MKIKLEPINDTNRKAVLAHLWRRYGYENQTGTD